MMKLLLIIISIIIILLICFIYYWYKYSIFNTALIKAKDGEYYRVHLGHSEQRNAADILAMVNRNNIRLFKQIIKDFPEVKKRLRDSTPVDPNSNLFADAMARMIRNYNVDNLVENSPRNIKKETSYIEDKGVIIAFCLRESNSKIYDIHDINTIMFVVLHELSHVANADWGHELIFWRIFAFLVEEARLAGIYDPVEYEKYPVEYCSLNLDYSPYFDPRFERAKLRPMP